MVHILSCSCLCAIYWRQVSSQKWRCSCCSADRQCSSYIWVINKLIAYQDACYITCLMVIALQNWKIIHSSTNRRCHYHRLNYYMPIQHSLAFPKFRYFGVRGNFWWFMMTWQLKKLMYQQYVDMTWRSSSWYSFWQTLGFITLILNAEAVHIFHWLWNGRNFCMNFTQFEHFFNEMDTYSSNGYQLVLLQLYSISTVMPEGLNLNIIWKSSKSTNMLFL